MISRVVVTCTMVTLLFVAGVIAGDNPLLKDKDSPSGEGQRHNKRIRLLEYVDDIPQYGNYYEWDGSKWQRYKAAIPQHGNYLKEVRPEERSPEPRKSE